MSFSFDSLLPFELDGYIFIKAIGYGSFSHCYLVKSIKYDVFYCAKVSPLDPALIDDEGNICEPEIAALLNLDHPFIIQLFHFFVAYQSLFLILELCEKTLDEFLITDGPLHSEKIKCIAANLVSALCDCHTKYIAHRDIKPANIFIDKYGRAKLGDFGLSALLNKKELLDTICGSRAFLAPEVSSGKPFCPFKADVWALGVTFYQLATGKLPFIEDESIPFEENNENPSNPLINLFSVSSYNYNTINYPPELNLKLVSMIQRMLIINPEDRPTLKEIASDAFFVSARTIPPAPQSKILLSTSEKLSNFHTKSSSFHDIRKRSISSSMTMFHTSSPKNLLFRPIPLTKSRRSLNKIFNTSHERFDLNSSFSSIPE
ncbi:CAMK family protein kinase [Tritrichomonas foetus]|uniref:CAMK family protein kinase n=1 Tax=Tritrichomonas foetus TaxID=1144522 RepID=A0A1J4K405_9EUKA|nr:CAMK family protein kinase [Tritrichomonas foetus]|eukprot:OHT05698.1 CAMK family protein kinase [Tritrichomonas foetus]